VGTVCSAIAFAATSFVAVASATPAHAAGWSAVPTPRAQRALSARLHGIACTSATACTAVGDVGEVPGTPYAEHFDGHEWAPTATPNLGTGWTATLKAVACDLQGPVAERWNGQHWTLINPPPPDAGGPGELTTVSCVAHTQCWAVGGFGSREMELWNGSAWSKVALPGSGYTLEAVSCLPSQPCVAVGTQALRYG
jgi:hypothetical protein